MEEALQYLDKWYNPATAAAEVKRRQILQGTNRETAIQATRSRWPNTGGRPSTGCFRPALFLAQECWGQVVPPRVRLGTLVVPRTRDQAIATCMFFRGCLSTFFTFCAAKTDLHDMDFVEHKLHWRHAVRHVMKLIATTSHAWKCIGRIAAFWSCAPVRSHAATRQHSSEACSILHFCERWPKQCCASLIAANDIPHFSHYNPGLPVVGWIKRTPHTALSMDTRSRLPLGRSPLMLFCSKQRTRHLYQCG